MGMSDFSALSHAVRLILMRDAFRDGARMTTHDIAQRFGVSVRTAQRDIYLMDCIGLAMVEEWIPKMHGKQKVARYHVAKLR